MSKPHFLLLHTRPEGDPILVNLASVQSITEVSFDEEWDPKGYRYVKTDARPGIRADYANGASQYFTDNFEDVSKVLALKVGVLTPETS